MSEIRKNEDKIYESECKNDQLEKAQIVIDLGTDDNIIEFTDDQDGDSVFLKFNANYNFLQENQESRELAKHIRKQMLRYKNLMYETQDIFNAEDYTNKIKYKLVIEFDRNEK